MRKNILLAHEIFMKSEFRKPEEEILKKWSCVTYNLKVVS
jgi:hypothetical protein